jgi:phage terminase small subunit
MASNDLSAKHERFCQATAEGMNGVDAYLWAGYQSSAAAAKVSANRLLTSAPIQARIAVLLEQRRQMNLEATEKAMEKLEITKERVLGELAKIAFSETRSIVNWRGETIEERTEEPGEDGGDAITVKHIHSSQINIISSDQVDDETHGAIAEVSQTASGIKVKMYDKQSALMALGKHMGMFIDRQEVTGKDGKDLIPEPSDRDLARAVLDILRTAKVETPDAAG